MHLDRKVQITALIAYKVPITIPAEYSDFEDVFSKKSVTILPEYIEINMHVSDLQKSKQLSYGPIYSLKPVELKILKTYIKTNLANGFIYLFKSSISAPILFNKKPNRSFWFCVDY